MNVLNLLSKSKLPVDAGYLIDKLKVNKTTVYRQVEKLLADNLVTEIDFGDGKKRYELKSLGHHHHLVCKNCGKLEDVRLDEESLLRQISKKTKFRVDSHNLEFFGRCINCS